MAFELFIGLRYLKAKRKNNFISLITFLSIGGVTLGVMTLIIVISVINGFEEKMKEKILGVNSHIVILKQNREGTIKEYRSIIDLLKNYKRIEKVNPFVYSQAMLSSRGKTSGVFLRGVTASYISQIKDFAKIERVSFSLPFNKDIIPLSPPLSKGDSGEFDGIIIGKELASKLNVKLNDFLTMITPHRRGSLQNSLAGFKRFKIVGIFDSGMYEYDLNLAYISLENAQSILGINDSVSGIEIKTDDPYSCDEIVRNVRSRLKFPYLVRDWKEMNRNLFTALWTQKIILFIIIMLIIVVAAFNIISTLIMMVIEKTKEISILRSIGATRNNIRKLFIIQGAVIGIAGTLLGDIGGYIACMVLKKYPPVEDTSTASPKTIPIRTLFIDTP